MTDDVQQAARAFRAAPAMAEAELETAERRIAELVETNVRARARSVRRSGKLDRSIRTTVKGHGAEAVVTVRAGAPHAHLVAGGTRPHRIAAVHREAIVIREGGRTRFASGARHPGTRPRPFFAQGLDASASDIDRILADTGDAILDDITTSIRRR